MREIKFRGKRVDNGELVYGFYFEIEHNDDKTHVHGYITANPLLEKMPESAASFIEVETKTVGQFTGLCDKNGVEIYEGDLCADKDSIVQIVWSENHRWGCKIVKTEYILKKDLTFPLWQWDRCEKNGNRELEVIGNIHENPGLLEQQPCG